MSVYNLHCDFFDKVEEVKQQTIENLNKEIQILKNKQNYNIINIQTLFEQAIIRFENTIKDFYKEDSYCNELLTYVIPIKKGEFSLLLLEETRQILKPQEKKFPEHPFPKA